MTSGLGTRDRRTLLVGGAIVATLLVLGRGIPAMRGWQSRTVAGAEPVVAEAARRQASLRDAAATRDSLRLALARLATLDSAFVFGGTPAAVSAGLATIVTESAQIAELSPESMQLSIDSTSDRGYLHPTARTQVTGDLASVAAFVESLEEGPALIAVRELSLVRAADGAPVGAGAVRIRADVYVEGIARQPGSQLGGTRP